MELMKHQAEARRRYRTSSVIPLFFDPGTGKTLASSVIMSDKYNDGLIDAVLIIAPNKVDRQWSSQELPLYIQNGLVTRECVIYNNKKSKKPIPFVEGKLNIVCTNIDQFSTTTTYKRYVDWLNAHRGMIILDEATRIKNPKAKRTERLLYEFNDVVRRGRAVLRSTPRTVARIILTGTPVTNGPFDVWSMFEFLAPGYFGLNWYAFQNKYGMFHSIDVNGRIIRIPISEKEWNIIHACDTFEQANMLYGVTLDTFDIIKQQVKFEGPYKHIEELRKLMLRDAMFVKIEDVIDMPERKYIVKNIEMSPAQTKAYNEMESDLITVFDGKEMTAASRLTMYLRLQQIASGFISTLPVASNEEEMLAYLQDPPPTEITWLDATPPKLTQLMVDVEELVGQPLIIICRFSAEALLIYENLTKAGYKVGLQTGFKTVGTIEGFQKREYDILIANIKVLSMGFNLQVAHYMIFYGNSYSLEDRIQVEARIYRKGQSNKCIYIDYVSYNTIDMKVLAALRQKKSLSDYIKDKSAKECLQSWSTQEQQAVYGGEFIF